MIYGKFLVPRRITYKTWLYMSNVGSHLYNVTIQRRCLTWHFRNIHLQHRKSLAGTDFVNNVYPISSFQGLTVVSLSTKNGFVFQEGFLANMGSSHTHTHTHTHTLYVY